MHGRHKWTALSLAAGLCCMTVAASAKHDDPEDHVAASEDADRPIQWTLRDNSQHSRPQDLALTLSLWPDSFGFAFWYGIPVAPNGFIRDVNDSFDIELGAVLAIYRASYYWQNGPTVVGLIPSFGVRYNLHLTRDWTTFASLKLGVLFGFSTYDFYNDDWVDVQFTLGALYRLQQSMQLRIELGYPFGFSVGLSFPVGGG